MATPSITLTANDWDALGTALRTQHRTSIDAGPLPSSVVPWAIGVLAAHITDVYGERGTFPEDSRTRLLLLKLVGGDADAIEQARKTRRAVLETRVALTQVNRLLHHCTRERLDEAVAIIGAVGVYGDDMDLDALLREEVVDDQSA